ncbi:MAG TPA: Clp protease N-terminal domain-containing protein [Pseudonocardiaceae bacterium]|nr:Clp protease N-terminal domain-containing protein [Pseudonocardiaceae bacterium]
MLERFTEQARAAVVTVAQQQARHLPVPRGDGKPEVTVAHLLLALAEGKQDRAADVLHAHGVTASAVRDRLRAGRVSQLDADALASIGIDLAAVREAAEASFGPGALETGNIGRNRVPFGAEAKRVLSLAVRAVGDPHRHRIGTEHVLLGVLRVADGVTAEILTELHVDQRKLAAEVAEVSAA